MDYDKYKVASYILVSENRSKVYFYLVENEIGMPVFIANEVGIRKNHISKFLSELKKENIVECINPEAHKGRLYRLTNYGIEVKPFVEKIKNRN